MDCVVRIDKILIQFLYDMIVFYKLPHWVFFELLFLIYYKMGKEQTQEKVVETKFEGKKIIKKFPFKNSKSKCDPEDKELKDWKPQKISEIKQQERKTLQNQKNNIASSFLSALPKPANKTQQKPSFMTEKIMMKPVVKSARPVQPTAQQIKWDIEDQSFIKKQFLNEEKKIQHQLAEEDEGDITVDRIKWLNEEPQKTKEIDLTKIIEKDWKANVNKATFQNDIWSTSFLKGKGQLSHFVNQAIKTFDEDEVTINRRAMIKQKIKSRYGW